MGDGRSPSILVCRFTKSFCTISWPWRQMHVELVVVVLGVGVSKWRRRRRRKMRKEFTPRTSCRARRAVLDMPSFAAPRRPDVSHLFLLPASLDPNAFYSDSHLRKSHESSTQKVADPVSNLIWSAGQVQKFVGHTRRSIPQPFPSPIYMQGRQPPIPIEIHRKDSVRDDRSSILYNPRFRMTLRLPPLPSSHAISKPSRNGRAQFSSP